MTTIKNDGSTESIINIHSADYPPKPQDLKFLTLQEKYDKFGSFTYTVNADSTITFTSKKNFKIAKVVIPQLLNQINLKAIWINEKAVESCLKLYQDWESADLIKLIYTFDGSYVPRMIRGSKTTLSEHAFGTAFDINANWNQLNTEGALVGEYGSVRELVEIAYENNWYWGGFFSNRKDPMHFQFNGV